MRKVIDLSPGDFPELDPASFDQAAFQQWQQAAHNAERRVKILWGALLALMFVLLLFGGVLVAPGVLPIILIGYFMSQKSRRLAGVLGLTRAAISRAQRFNEQPVDYDPTMKCPTCTSALNVAVQECPFCHQAFAEAEVEQRVARKREEARAATTELKIKYAQRRLTTLKTAIIVAAILGALLALIIYYGLEAEPESYWTNMSLLVYCAMLVMTMLVTAWGVAKRKRWSRTLAIGLALISLPAIPFGTLLGIYTLVVMSSAEVKEAFVAVRA